MNDDLDVKDFLRGQQMTEDCPNLNVAPAL